MTDTKPQAAHPKCQGPAGHICQQPSGRVCIEAGCARAAGTWWGPMWCPQHDEERLNRVSASLESILADMRNGVAQ